jgi:hypothetical protein
MRCAPICAILLLAACGPAGAPEVISNGAEAPPAGAPDNRIDCRPEGESDFARACTVETFDGAEGRILTIRKADGGFRRLRVTSDGRGVAAADGAARAQVTLLPDGRIEVEIGGDRFRLPARTPAR